MPLTEEDRRSGVLTERDMEKLVDILSRHPCRFQITHEEMDDLKRFSTVLRGVERGILDGIKWMAVAAVVAFIWLLTNHGYFTRK